MSSKQVFIDALIAFGKDTITKPEISKICSEKNIPSPQWFTNDPNNRVSRGVYKIPAEMQAQVIKMPTTKTEVQESLVPEVYDNYVPFGNFDDILNIIKSKMFFPVFISGLSGNGKTMSIEQACAKLKREFVCVSMTPETDEGDLLGNYVLINGQMEWRDGPVTTAAKRGAVLVLDEIDYGSTNLSTLQRVLEGKPFLLKKKNETVYPKEGFTVFATANTKGKGSEDGRYMYTNILNEAFLERFPNTFEQVWPPIAVEKQIIKSEMKSSGNKDDEFAEKLVDWADVIRKTFDEGGCDEVISTRRLVHIAKTYGVFKDRTKAIQLCLNRFDDDTKISFVDLYTKLDAGISGKEDDKPEVKIQESEEIAF